MIEKRKRKKKESNGSSRVVFALLYVRSHFCSSNFSSPLFPALIDSSPWPKAQDGPWASTTEGATGVDACVVILARTDRLIFAGHVNYGAVAIDAVRSKTHCVLTAGTDQRPLAVQCGRAF